MIHKRVFTLYGNVTRLADTSIENPFAKRQLEIKTIKSHSWFVAVKKTLLKKYDLPSGLSLQEKPIAKFTWKKLFNGSVNTYWTERVLSQSKLYTSLKYLSKSYTVGKCHKAVKPYEFSNRDICRIPFKTKILTGTFILQSNRARFNQNEEDPTCQLCYAESETLTHFLLKCRNLETVRKHILDKFNTVLKDIITVFPDAAKYTVVQLLVDCGVILQEGTEYKHTNIISLVDLLHYHSRRLVYMYILHVTRFSQLPVTAKCTKNRRGTVRHTNKVTYY